MTIQGYGEFLSAKDRKAVRCGIDEIPELPDSLKPFQRAVVEWSLRQGRTAMFEGTGLGKTLQQLSWARAVADCEDAQVLILTPLAVAEQTVEEATKFGITGVGYARDSGAIRSPIVVTNYERFERFDPRRFAGIVLDESGIIKNRDGYYRAELTEAFSATPWRLCCTATPAPNDYAEIGQHAEFLGVMSTAEMLATFFVHDGAIRADDDAAGSGGWRLKRHAVQDFWRWFASWSVVIQHPRDLGFDDPSYDLPTLSVDEVIVEDGTAVPDGMLFSVEALTLSDRIRARRDTVEARVKAAVDLVLREPREPWIVWCNLNSEADLAERMLFKVGALQVSGGDDVDVKVGRLLGFKAGKPPILVSKPTIAGHGMNWQHCARAVFVGLTDSFEQVYQAIRRTWRFGQRHPVKVYFVSARSEGSVLANVKRKEAAFTRMLDAMAEHMRDFQKESVLSEGRLRCAVYDPQRSMELPDWLTSGPD